MEIKIRAAKREERREIAKVEQICFPPAEAASEETILERIDAFLENFFVAECNGNIVGYIGGGTTDTPHLPDEMYHDVKLHKPEGKYQTVFSLAVLPEYQKCGIGGMLIEKMLLESKNRGKSAVILTCKDYRVHYYEKFGFVNHGVSDSNHGNAVWYDMRAAL